MTPIRWTCVLLFAFCLIHPAPAGIFGRKPKPDPAKRVPELIAVVKSDPSESKRADAAAELRDYDAKTFTDIQPTLADALTRDAATAVRAAAAGSLGRLRPIHPAAGYALEQAAANDSALRVRLAARQALWSYQLVGYRSAKPAKTTTSAKPAAGQSKEPPTAEPVGPSLGSPPD